MPESKHSPRKVLARMRELRAVELRVKGWRYDEIAQELGVSESGARALVKRAMDDNREKLQETVKEHTELDLARIEALIQVLWERVEDRQRGWEFAVDKIERLLARKAKLLGLDAPDRLKVSGDGGPLELSVRWPEDKTE